MSESLGDADAADVYVGVAEVEQRQPLHGLPVARAVDGHGTEIQGLRPHVRAVLEDGQPGAEVPLELLGPVG